MSRKRQIDNGLLPTEEPEFLEAVAELAHMAQRAEDYLRPMIENRLKREWGRKSGDKRLGTKRRGSKALRVKVKHWWKYYRNEDERRRAGLIHVKLKREVDIQTVRKIIRELGLRKANR